MKPKEKSSSFKMSKEADDHFVMTHPDGHFLKIAKKGLSQDTINSIKMACGGKVGMSSGGQVNPKLQQSNVRNYDEGGEVKGNDSNGSFWDSITKPIDIAGYAKKGLKQIGTLGGLYPDNEAQASPDQPQQIQSTPAPQPQSMVPSDAVQGQMMTSMPPGRDVTTDVKSALGTEGQNTPVPQGPATGNGVDPNSNDFYALQRQALGQANAADMQIGAAQKAQMEQQAQITAKQAEDVMQFDADMSRHAQEFSQEAQSQIKDYNEQKLDFHRMWNSKSDGQKALSLMGMILGGAASGVTGGPNPAMQVLDKMMERDIEQQKADLGKKQNMYGMFLKKYGNERDASVAHMAALNNIFNTKMEQVALQQKGSMALPAAQSAIQQRNMKMYPELQQMFQRQSAFDALNRLQNNQSRTPSVDSGEPVSLLESGPDYGSVAKSVSLRGMAGVDKPEDQKEMATEAKLYGESQSLLGDFKEEFRHLSSQNAGGINNWADRERAVNTLTAKLMGTEFGIKRFPQPEAAREFVESFLPGHRLGIGGNLFGVQIPRIGLGFNESPAARENKYKSMMNLFDVNKYPKLQGAGILPSPQNKTRRLQDKVTYSKKDSQGEK